MINPASALNSARSDALATAICRKIVGIIGFEIRILEDGQRAGQTVRRTGGEIFGDAPGEDVI